MYNWNWSVLWIPASDGVTSFAMTLVYGLGWTLLVGLSAWALALLIGTAVGIARTRKAGGLSRLADGYVEVLRSVPLIVQMFLWFYVAPDIFPDRTALVLKEWDRYNVLAAVLCLALFTSARVAEQVRAGIQAIPTGQFNAARALGMRGSQVYRHVLLPTAFRNILPALTNEFLNSIKNTSVAFTIAVVELMAATRTMQEMTYQIFEAFTVATLIYLGVNLIIVKAMAMVERHVEMPGYGRAGR